MLGDRWSNSSNKLGSFSGDGGAAQDSSIKASLDLAHTDLDTIIVGAARVATKTLVAWTAAAQNLFTITGGPIRVLSLTGTILVDIKDVAMNLSIVAAVTTPTASVDIASVLACQNDDAGGIYTVNATFGSIMVSTDAGILAAEGAEFIMPIGTINMTSSAVEDGGGSIRWDIVYRRLSPASRLVPVA